MMGQWRWSRNSLLYDGKPSVAISLVGNQEDRVPSYRPEFPLELPGASPFVLWEWAKYQVTVKNAPPALRIRYGDKWAESLGQGIFHLQYRNSLGASLVEFVGADIPPLHVEVLSKKMGAPSEPLSYPVLYRQMLRDLVNIFLTLPFDLSSPTAQSTELAPDPPAPLFSCLFLKKHAGSIRQALGAIEREPFRQLASDEVIVPLGKLRRVSTSALTWGLTHPDIATAVSDPTIGWYEESGSWYVPGRLPQALAEETYDTPENRFVKWYMAQLYDATVQAQALIQRERAQDVDLQESLQQVADALQTASRWDWLSEVGEMTHLPDASMVMMRRAGYEELYTSYQDYLFSRTPFSYGLSKSLSTRNIGDIYEYWCYFRLVNDLASNPWFGTPVLQVRTTGTGGLARGVTATFGRSVRVVYNEHFPGGKRSYSVGLRPDITVFRGRRVDVVLDAKFRMDALPLDLSDPDVLERAPEVEDLYKMHTYRDALGIRAAVVIYPGERAVFYHADTGQRSENITLHDILTDHSLSGIGAIPYSPRGGNI